MFENVNGNELRSTVSPDFKTSVEPITLKDFMGREGVIYGFITKNTKYGKYPMLAVKYNGECMFIGLPARYSDKLTSLSDAEVNELMSGNHKITDVKEVNCKNGTKTVCFSIK